MRIEIKLPELGEQVTSGTVSKVLVAAGDAVAENQSIIEIETGKAVAEIPCTAAGTVAEVLVSEGQEIKPGEVILVLEASDAATERRTTAPPPAVPATAPEKTSPPAALPSTPDRKSVV